MENKNRANHSTLKYLKMLPLIALVIGCILILQLHAIPKWQELTGFYGMYISMLLELLGIFAWLNKKIPLAISTSLLLILVPLFQLVSPTYNEVKLYDAIESNIKTYKIRISRNESLLKKYVDQKWAGKATNIEKLIYEQEQLLIGLKQQLIKIKTPVLLYISSSIEIVALIIFLLAQITLLRVLRSIHTEPIPNDISEKEVRWKVSNNSINQNDILSEAIWLYGRLFKYKKLHGISWKEISHMLEVPPSTLTRIKNIIEDKPEKASYEMLKRVSQKVDKLGIFT